MKEKEALNINNAIIRLLNKAEKLHQSKYYRYSIQIEEDKAILVGHVKIDCEGDSEYGLGNITDLITEL
jgi:hypothetical protein